MPRPPILPTLDWKTLFSEGIDFDAWLAAAEIPDNAQKMKDTLNELEIDAATIGFLKALPKPVAVVAFAEDWCGDVVRFTPALRKMELASDGRLSVRFLRRDQAPDAFARFITNGGEGVPKYVVLSDGWIECGHWGPKPKNAQEWIARGKVAGDMKTAYERVGSLYAADPQRKEMIKELLPLVEIAVTQKL